MVQKGKGQWCLYAWQVWKAQEEKFAGNVMQDRQTNGIPAD